MPIFRFLAATVLVFGVIVGIAIQLIFGRVFDDPPEPPVEIVHAYGIQSACGYFGVVVIYSDGNHILYDKNPVPNEINEIPSKDRTTIVVPCPPPSLQPLNLEIQTELPFDYVV